MISIVDDDLSVREATSGLVRSLGYRAAAFGSAEEFLGSAVLPDTDCVITDLQMQGVDGIGLQNALATRDRSIPVIFITAYPEDKARARALGAGAIGFLTKPYQDDELIDCIDRALTFRTLHRRR